MKKLLMLGAILAMGAMAYGEEATAVKGSGEANVKVRAEITNDTFTITDIDGQPIVLDFGKVTKKGPNTVTTSTKYKVEFGTGLQADGNLEMELNGKKVASTKKIYYNGPLTAGEGEYSFDTIIGLNKYNDSVTKDETKYVGVISGTIDKNKANVKANNKNTFGELKEGVYEGNTTLKVTLTDA